MPASSLAAPQVKAGISRRTAVLSPGDARRWIEKKSPPRVVAHRRPRRDEPSTPSTTRLALPPRLRHAMPASARRRAASSFITVSVAPMNLSPAAARVTTRC